MVPDLVGSTAIEFTHRAISGTALALVIWLAVRVRRSTPPAHPARKASLLGVAAIIGEALIGALIVFSEWVADDVSLARVVAVPLHLVNTLLLLLALTTTVFLSGERHRSKVMMSRGVFVWGAVGMMAVAATGAVTALADTLFPKEGFALAGIMTVEDGEHLLTRLRVIHPFASVIVGLVVGVAGWRHRRVSVAARIVMAAVVTQMVLGVVNVWLPGPLGLSLAHLLVADLLWICWVWMGVESGIMTGPVTERGPIAGDRSEVSILGSGEVG